MRCIHSVTVLATTLLASLVGVGATPGAAATCASLADLALPHTTITAAQAVPAGTFATRRAGQALGARRRVLRSGAKPRPRRQGAGNVKVRK